MEEETVSVKLNKSLQSSKEFVSRGYHNFADYVNNTYAEHKRKGNNKTLKMAFAKYVLVFLDILYMIISLLMINVGTAGQIISANVYIIPYELNVLSVYWIATGVILLLASIFGLIGAFKESIVWTNVFGVFMVIIFLGQISSAIVAFQFIGKSQSIAYNGINRLMDSYSYDTGSQNRMNWIQRNFQCCGNDAPSDWNRNSNFRRFESGGYYYFRSKYDHSMTTTTTTPTTTLSTPLPDRTPSSCCVDGSTYNNLTCERYYQTGCCIHVREVISETVMIIGCLALAIAVFEILGIFFAFVVAKIMRKSFIAIQHYDTLNNVPVNSETPTARPEGIAGEGAETL